MHPNPDNVRRGRGDGTAVLGDGVRALWAVRQFVRLEIGSGKMALSRPGRAPEWRPILPMLRNTPKGHTLCRAASPPRTQTRAVSPYLG